MTSLDRVVNAAKSLVVPRESDRRKTVRVAEKVMSSVKRASARYPEVAGASFGGSFAKDTWLPGDVDIDIFVKISSQVDEERFEEIGLGVGREALRGYKPGKKYAQHPYTEATVDGFKVNVVPCYDVKPGEWRSAADRSIYHVTFVKQNLDAEARLQVRLLKRFMKAVGVYGAEIETEGFSGYAAEVLVYKHKELEAVLGSFAGFVPSSKDSYFMLFDPVDEKRDLGKAISKESVAKMVLASRSFLERPSPAFFREVRGKARRKLQKLAYVIAFTHEELSEDTLWGELRRSTRQTARHLREKGFVLSRIEAASDNARSSAMILLPLVDTLPDMEERLGPGVEMNEASKRFIEKNRREAGMIWVGEDGRLRLLAERRVTSLADAIGEILESGVEKIGVSKELARAIKKNGRLLRGNRLQREAARSAWLKEGLERVFSDSVGA